MKIITAYLILAFALLAVGELFRVVTVKSYQYLPVRITRRVERITTSKDNTAFGYCAMRNLTTGKDNVFVGDPKYFSDRQRGDEK